jgi:hypothetical protein
MKSTDCDDENGCMMRGFLYFDFDFVDWGCCI